MILLLLGECRACWERAIEASSDCLDTRTQKDKGQVWALEAESWKLTGLERQGTLGFVSGLLRSEFRGAFTILGKYFLFHAFMFT